MVTINFYTVTGIDKLVHSRTKISIRTVTGKRNTGELKAHARIDFQYRGAKLPTKSPGVAGAVL